MKTSYVYTYDHVVRHKSFIRRLTLQFRDFSNLTYVTLYILKLKVLEVSIEYDESYKCLDIDVIISIHAKN